MFKISIVKVESPACLWGRVVRGAGSEAETTEHYNNLLAQMNLFYHDVTQDVQKMKPSSFEEGQVCVVYWEVVKSWCRAVVESIIMDSVSCKARCLLVDHGERLIISSDQIRIAMQKFLQLPFWVKKFHLAGIKPTTLQVSVYERMAELIPCGQWDSSATLYLHSLLQGSTEMEAVMVESEFDSTSIELYLTIDNIKVSVNDDLVAKKFAYYSRKSADGDGCVLADRFPLMLSSNTLTQTTPTTSGGLAAQNHTPLASYGAGDWLSASSLPAVQGLQQPVDSEGDCGATVTRQMCPNGTSRNGLGVTATAKSALSEETDWSLATAVKENLSLLRFLKFMNSASCSHQQTPRTVSQNEGVSACQLQEAPATSEVCAAPQLCDSVETAAAGTMKWSEEERLCSQLLEWLNPDPLKPDTDEATDTTSCPSDPRASGILVHSAFPLQSCPSLAEAPLTDTLHSVMRRHQYSALSPADCYSWPAVARGCNTLIISNTADEPLSYLAPLLSHIQLNSVSASPLPSSGPITVLLCPGREKVQAVYDLLEERRVSSLLHPMSVLLGIGKDEAKAVKITKNCLLVVTTPFTLVRLLATHCFLFLRLYHLVLDEADQLFTLAPEQMETILQHFQKVTSSEEKAACPQQLLAVAKRWTVHMEGLLSNHMPYPCVVITVPEEAALYGNVQQITLMTLESSKISVLLSTLDFNPDMGQKTLIVANSMRDVEDVFQALSNKSAFCLKTHEGLTHQFDLVVQQWRKDIGPGTHVVLVTTNECLECLGIRDATCVVHYGFPTSPKLFGSRLFCMADNFRNFSQRDPEEKHSRVTQSVLLISEKNARHVVGVMRYLDRTDAPLPPELRSFAQDVHTAREDQKENRPLCYYLKSFGVCRDSSVCPDRHRFIPHLDHSQLPASGVIEVLPLYIRTASVFSGRLIRSEDREFNMLSAAMDSYYADKKPGAQELLQGGLYTVQEGDTFHRVKILSVPDRGDRLFFSVLVRFIDVGKEEEVKSHQVLQLPDQFHSLPGQAVEFIVCQVKPVDAETDWHPKVTRLVSQKIRGRQHKARAVLSLGNTVFLDPMVLVTKVPGLKTFINEHNVQSDILNSGMGVSNPEHLDLLRALCQDGLGGGGGGCGTEATPTFGQEDGSPPLEVGTKAEEEILAEAFSVAVVQEPPTPDLHSVPACDLKSQVMNLTDGQMKPTRSAQQLDREGDGNVQAQLRRDDPDVCPAGVLSACVSRCENGEAEGECEGSDESSGQHVVPTNEAGCQDSTRSFHPQVCWYDTRDSVVVTVKLQNATSQRCQFYPDRVVYSGRVGDRSYTASLELHQNIVADCCCWEMKSNQPVLKLVKQQQGHWERLVRNKNIFVSYDMEHFSEDKDTAPSGPCFLENTGETFCYVNSESDSDSD